jgi:hypothetical protein
VYYNNSVVKVFDALRLAYDLDYDFSKRKKGENYFDDLEVIDILGDPEDENSFDNFEMKKIYRYFDPVTKSYYNTIDEFNVLRGEFYSMQEKKLNDQIYQCEQLFIRKKQNIARVL